MNERIGVEEKYIIRDGFLVNEATGEIILDEEILLTHRQKGLIQDYGQLKEDSRKSGIPLDIKMITSNNKKYQGVIIKRFYNFNRVFRSETIRVLDEISLDPYSLAFIGRFLPYIIFPQNYIQIDKKFPSIELFATKMNIKARKIYMILDDLEYKDIIRRERYSKYIVVYFNPFLYSSGNPIMMDTYKLFEKSPSNPYEK